MAKQDSTLPKGLFKRGNYYHAAIQHDGIVVRESLKCTDLDEAIYKLNRLREKVSKNYYDAKWVNENNQNRDWIRKLFSSAKKRTESSGVEFSITYEYVAQLVKDSGLRCQITGISFSWNKPEHCRVSPYVPSLDRIDSRKGYVEGNVRIVCWAANIAMSDWGEEVFLRVAKLAVAKHLIEN